MMRVTTSCTKVLVGTSSPELSNWVRRWDYITHLFIRIMPQPVGTSLPATVQRIMTDCCKYSRSMIQMESFRVCNLDTSSCRCRAWYGHVNRWNFSNVLIVLDNPYGKNFAVCSSVTAYFLSAYKQIVVPGANLKLGLENFGGG